MMQLFRSRKHDYNVPGAMTLRVPALSPIAGVSLELYAQIARGLAAHDYDQSRAQDVAGSHGVDPSSWSEAMDGWNARMREDSWIAGEFNRLYARASD